MYALIHNNIVVQVAETPFDVHSSLKWEACPDNVVPGWKHTSNGFEPFASVVTWDQVRHQRNQLLLESDWVVIKAQETGQSVSRAWLEYREALRNITLQPNLQNINWPVKPS